MARVLATTAASHAASHETALVFENGSVRGAGVDMLGDFEIAGMYDVANGSC